jgi:hypothetical protein
MPVILAIQEAEIRRIMVRSQTWQIVCETLSQKYPMQKRAGGVTQVVQYLPTKHEALSSNHSNLILSKFTKTNLLNIKIIFDIFYIYIQTNFPNAVYFYTYSTH